MPKRTPTASLRPVASLIRRLYALRNYGPGSPLSGGGMKVGVNMSGISNFGGGSAYNNLLHMMSALERIVGSTAFTQEQGKVTTASSTDEFRGTIIDNGLVDLPGIYGEYTLLNPSGVTVGIGAFGSPNFLAYSSSTAARTFNYTGGSLCYFTKGQTNLTAGPPVLVKTSNLASWNAGCVWSPEFLSFHAGLGERVMRMMDWSNTSGSVETDFTDRVRPDLVSLSRPGVSFVPWEFMIDLCNRLGTDPWIHVAARETDAYVNSLKAMWNDGTGRVAVPNIASLQNASGLNAARTLYVTVSNETWNQQAPWVMGYNWFLFQQHTKYDVTVNPQVDTELVNWTGHGLSTGNNVAMFTVPSTEIQNMTDANPAAGPSSGNVYRAKYGWGDLKALVIDANHIKIQYDIGGGTLQTLAFPTIAQYMAQPFSTLSFKAVKVAERATDTTVMNTNYGTRCKEVGNSFKATMGSRAKMIVESQAFGDFNTTQRLAPSGVAVATDLLAIAPYFEGEQLMGVIDQLSATSFRPRFWGQRDGRGYVNFVPTGSAQPTDDQLMNHTGGGIVAGHDWAYFNGAGFYQAGTDETAAVSGTAYDVYFSYHNAGESRTQYLWTFKATITMDATKAATSTSSVTVNTGNQSFTTQTGKAFAAGQDIAVYRTSDPSVYVDGKVVSYNSGTGALVVGVGRTSGSGTFTDWTIATRTYVYDTFANQLKRNRLDTDIDGLANIAAHKARIAESANPAIKLACYESTNHMAQDGQPAEMQNWIQKQYLESPEYAQALDHNMRQYAAEPDMEIQCLFSELTETVWTLATTHFDTADVRYQKVASFNGFVPRSARVAVSDIDVGNMAAAPGAFPSTIATMADATLTYEVMSGDLNNNFSFVGAALKMNNATGINFAVSVQRTIYCRATNGQTDCLFKISLQTGPALWYPPATRFAWSTVDDTTPAQLNPAVGNALASTTPGVVATGGWDMNDVANYSGGGATGSTLYSESPLVCVVARKNVDAGSDEVVAQIGSNPSILIFTQFGNLLVGWDDGTTFTSALLPIDNTLAVYSVWLDDTNHKAYILKNLTESTVGGVSYSAHTGGFNDFVRIGGGTQLVIGGGLVTPAPGTLANAKSFIQSVMTKHGIS